MILAAGVTGLVCVRMGEGPVSKTSDAGVTITGSAMSITDGGDPPKRPPLRLGTKDASVALGTPTLHSDPQRTNRSLATGPRSHPQARIRFDAKAPIATQVVASRDEKHLHFATLGGRVIAIDRAGHTRFSVDLGDRIYGTPLVSESAIYVGSDAKKFFAISPEGTILWRLDLEGEADVAPLEWDTRFGRRIVFAAGPYLYAVRAHGDVAFRYKAAGKIFTAPAATHSGLIVFGSQDGHVYGLRSQGELAFRVALGSDVDGAPAVLDDDAVVVGTDNGEIVKLTHDGAVVWRTRASGFVRGTLMVGRNGDIVAGTYGPTPRLVRLDGTSGDIVRSFAIVGTGAKEFGIHGAPLEDAVGNLFFGAQDNHVYVVTPELELLYALKMGGDVDAPLTLLKDGTLVVPCDDGTVTLFSE